MSDCTVCNHPNLADIHRAVDASGGINATADRYGISRTTLKRHLANHRKDGGAPPAPPPKPSEPRPTSERTAAVGDRAPAGDRAPGVALTDARRHCLVCRSPDRDAIERALLGGESPDSIGKRYPDGPSHDTIARHFKLCIGSALSAARDTRIEQLVTEVRPRVEALVSEAEQLIADAAERDDAGAPKGSLRERAAVLTAAKGCLELLARMVGELGPDVEVKLLSSPQFQAFRSAVVRGIAAIPDPTARAMARSYIGAELKRADAGAAVEG